MREHCITIEPDGLQRKAAAGRAMTAEPAYSTSLRGSFDVILFSHMPAKPSTTLCEEAKSAAPQFYVPELDGLRFIAFILVFFHHLAPDQLAVVPSPIREFLSRLVTFGWSGVDVFFCLSAFLITSLLLREQTLTGKLSLKRFYIRRALRIWPLYFWCLFLAFVIFPAAGYFSPGFGTPEHFTLLRQHLMPYLVFLGNFSYAVFPASLTFAISPLWSISVEEQFYLLWPLLLSQLPQFSRRTFWIVLGGLLSISILVRSYIMINNIPYPMVWTNTLGRMDPLIMGTAVALLYFRTRTIMPPWLALSGALVLYYLVTSFPQVGASQHTIWQLLAVAIASALLLIGVLGSRFSRPVLGNPVLRWCGKLSFGFYVYHKAAILAAAVLLRQTVNPALPGANLILGFVLSLAITIAISAVSYYAFERRFLLLKDRFAVVHSGGVR